jgi:hypothetical protein
MTIRRDREGKHSKPIRKYRRLTLALLIITYVPWLVLVIPKLY